MEYLTVMRRLNALMTLTVKSSSINKHMRFSVFSLFLVIIMAALIFLGCKEDSTSIDRERVTVMLTSAEAWDSPEVTVDGVDYSDIYKDFSITFTESAYTTVGGAPVWAASGTWKFLNEEATLLLLDDTREVEINSISDDILELSFQWNENTFEPGRVNSVKGKQKFKLKKKK